MAKKPVAKKKRVTNLFDSFRPTSDDALRASRGRRKRRRTRSKGNSTASALTPVASRKKQQAESGWGQLGEKPPYKGPTWQCKTGHLHRGRRPDGSPCTFKKPAKGKKAKKAKQRQQKQRPNIAELMGTATERVKPARITSVVRGGLPGLGKRR